MRRLSWLALAGGGVTLFAVALAFHHIARVHAQSSPGAPSSPVAVPCCKGEAPREIDFPYYDLLDGFQSTLMLVSDSPKPIDLTIAVKSLAGQMLTTSQTIGPSQKLSFDLSALVSKLGADPAGPFGEGSVSVFFTGTIMPVVGQISIRNPQLSLAHESVMVENDPGRSDIPAVLNGAWWGLGGGRTGRVMVSNTSGQAQAADVFLDFQGQRHTSQPLFFQPYETKVLDIVQLLTALGADPSQAADGGITIIQRGPHPALIANGRIVDPATGFSTTIDFPLTENEIASSLHADGLPVGEPSTDSPFAGAGSFVPHVVVRNLLSTPQSVTVTLEYPQAPSPDSATSTPAGNQTATPSGAAGNSKKVVIPPPALPGDSAHHPEWGAGVGTTTQTFPLAPTLVLGYSTEDISLAAVIAQLPLPLPFVSVRIQYSGAAGSMEAEVSSVEAKGSLVVDALAQNEGNTWAGSGANPWHLDSNTESILFLTDMSDKPAPIGFSITANGVHYYLTDLTLQPHETRMIDLRKLRDAQIPDFKGNKIPAGATDGSVDWIRLANVAVSGRLMVINRQAGMTSSFDCTNCCCPGQLTTMSAQPDIVDAVLMSQFNEIGMGGFTDCDNNVTYYNETDASTWASNDTSVCGIAGPGTIDANAAGTCTISASFESPGWTWDGGECFHGFPIKQIGYSNDTVQKPTSLSIVSGTSSTTLESSCTTGGLAGCGVTRTFKYQVNDQNGQPIKVANMPFGDVICNTSTNQLNLQSYTTTCGGTTGKCWGTAGPCNQFTDASGQFSEKIPVCAPACKPSGTCTTAGQTVANQTWTVAGSKLGSDVKSISYQCNKILVDGN